ncbi:19288_t:CDS:1, partial [Funneliformis geosporum]
MRATALYCDAYIKNVKIPLIIDSSSAGCIIFIKLLKDLDMEITGASKTIMVNINDEKRRPLRAVT